MYKINRTEPIDGQIFQLIEMQIGPLQPAGWLYKCPGLLLTRFIRMYDFASVW